jgi:hypothetical protein
MANGMILLALLRTIPTRPRSETNDQYFRTDQILGMPQGHLTFANEVKHATKNFQPKFGDQKFSIDLST